MTTSHISRLIFTLACMFQNCQLAASSSSSAVVGFGERERESSDQRRVVLPTLINFSVIRQSVIDVPVVVGPHDDDADVHVAVAAAAASDVAVGVAVAVRVSYFLGKILEHKKPSKWRNRLLAKELCGGILFSIQKQLGLMRKSLGLLHAEQKGGNILRRPPQHVVYERKCKFSSLVYDLSFLRASYFPQFASDRT